jgi:hypothetical protein
MRKRMCLLLLVFVLTMPQMLVADEKSDAEAAIAKATAMVEKINKLYFCPGPALVMKKEAVRQLQLANDALGAGNFGDALTAANLSFEIANKALGQRAYCYMYKHRRIYIPPPPTPPPTTVPPTQTPPP